jgi:hypothetical protein
MMQNCKLQLSLEDPKQAIIHPLDSCPPTKARLVVSKKVLIGLAAQGYSKLQHLKVSALLL